MPLYLLTHERELARVTNTGQLVLECPNSCRELQVSRILWQRKAPDATLLELAAKNRLWLLYPASGQVPSLSADTPLCWEQHHLVLLDATWQESQKMLRQSPYLQRIPRLSLAAGPSAYQLRRNQQQGALCTAEVVMQLLERAGQKEISADLAQRFAEFNQR